MGLVCGRIPQQCRNAGEKSGQSGMGGRAQLSTFTRKVYSELSSRASVQTPSVIRTGRLIMAALWGRWPVETKTTGLHKLSRHPRLHPHAEGCGALFVIGPHPPPHIQDVGRLRWPGPGEVNLKKRLALWSSHPRSALGDIPKRSESPSSPCGSLLGVVGSGCAPQRSLTLPERVLDLVAARAVL